jgi:hypothetical protein
MIVGNNNTYRNILPLLLIAAIIGLSIPAINVSVNYAMAVGAHGMRHGETGHGGVGPVIQEPVDTGNSQLDKAINKFYHCISHTHEDPPTIDKVDNCYYQTLETSLR